MGFGDVLDGKTAELMREAAQWLAVRLVWRSECETAKCISSLANLEANNTCSRHARTRLVEARPLRRPVQRSDSALAAAEDWRRHGGGREGGRGWEAKARPPPKSRRWEPLLVARRA
eukprot:scaffold48_cov311-Pinguiococcus_pyrenoidosus.AAC.15